MSDEPTDETDEEPAPLAELAADVGSRETEPEDEEIEEVFEEMEPETDVDALWEEIESSEAEEPLVAGEPVEAVGSDRDVRVIPNRICHRCRFFGDPPDLSCTHEGTEIREVVDTEHYEVVDCPMVVDEDSLED